MLVRCSLVEGEGDSGSGRAGGALLRIVGGVSSW